MAAERELERWSRRLAEGDDPSAWSGLAAAALRLGLRPGWLGEPGAVDRLLARLASTPGERPLAGLLELCLPLRILTADEGDPGAGWRGDPGLVEGHGHPYHQGSGRPVLVRLRSSGEVLLLARDGKSWEGAEVLDEERLTDAGFGLREPPARSRCAGSLAWFQAAEYAQHLTDRFRAEDLLAPSWELRLPRHSGRRHTFPEAKRRLVLARARRKQPRSPGLPLDRPLCAIDGSSFRRWLCFRRDGVLTHTTTGVRAQDLEQMRERLLPDGSVEYRGEWRQQGRELEAWVGSGRGRFEWRGFMGDDGGLRLQSTSRITGHQAANVWRQAR